MCRRKCSLRHSSERDGIVAHYLRTVELLAGEKVVVHRHPVDEQRQSLFLSRAWILTCAGIEHAESREPQKQ